MERSPHRARVEKVRQKLAAEQVDALLVAVPENRYYLSGFEAEDLLLTESSGYLLITDQDLFLVTDFRYEQAANAEAPDFQVVIYKEAMEPVLEQLFRASTVKVLAVEDHYLTHQRYERIAACLQKASSGTRIRGADGLVERLRLVKEAGEIERMRASLEITERVLEELWQRLVPGMTEKEVAWEIEAGIRRSGAEAVSFPPIVAGGPNGALPHAVPTERPLASGEPVVIDMGARFRLYCSDMTRTWVYGEPPPELKTIYRVVKEAQGRAQETIRAGIDSREVDAVARKIISDAGYGQQFGHGLGHGVGLAVHEKPGYGQTTGMVLEENMVVTVEPGIYLPGVGGVRLENMVRVTTEGAQVLNRLDLYYHW